MLLADEVRRFLDLPLVGSPPLASMDTGCTGQGLNTAMHLLGTQHLEGSAKV
jgi:hypothetical protein